MSMCRVFFYVVGRECFAMTSAFPWQNSVSLCPASFRTPMPNLPVTPGFLDFLLSWLPTTEPCVPGPRRKEQWSHRRLACGCLGVSAEGMGWQWPAAGLGAGTVAVHAWDLLKEVTVIFITSTIVWSQVNSRKGTQLHQSTESWIKDLGSMALLIRTRPSIPLSQSILSGSFHKPLILLHQRTDRLKTTITGN